MDTLDILIRDPKFWTAVLFLMQTLLFFAVPGFPPELWAALSGLLAVVFGALTTQATVQERRVRAVRAERRTQNDE